MSDGLMAARGGFDRPASRWVVDQLVAAHRAWRAAHASALQATGAASDRAQAAARLTAPGAEGVEGSGRPSGQPGAIAETARQRADASGRARQAFREVVEGAAEIGAIAPAQSEALLASNVDEAADWLARIAYASRVADGDAGAARLQLSDGLLAAVASGGAAARTAAALGWTLGMLDEGDMARLCSDDDSLVREAAAMLAVRLPRW